MAAHTGEPPPIFHGFDAHRGTVLGDESGPSALLGHRILHFATHGLVDAADPTLAGLVLSLYDAEGRPRSGFLPARDLHDVRFDADLVVLSACRTALGEEIRGADLVGLGQGFFAAGAQALVVSLWDVDDRATAELMVRFYGHLFAEDGSDTYGSDTAEALRRAQLELRDEGMSALHWGAFVVLGSAR